MDSWPPRLGVCWSSTTALRRTSEGQHSARRSTQAFHERKKNLRLLEVGLFKYFMYLESESLKVILL